MLFFYLWVLFGIGCIIIARQKNRSAVGWFFLGLLLGPFGLLFALLVSSHAPPVIPSALGSAPVVADFNTKTCPHCAETIKLEAVKCRYCGEKLDEGHLEAILAERAARRAAGEHQCPRCGSWKTYRAVIEDGGQGWWCPNCKMSLQKISAP